jgi:hypothetical protein
MHPNYDNGRYLAWRLVLRNHRNCIAARGEDQAANRLAQAPAAV